jgi:hypothetical protein
MTTELTDLFRMAEKLKASAEAKLESALIQCEQLTDENLKNYIKNSLPLLMSGKLNVDEFLKNVSNANGNTGK